VFVDADESSSIYIARSGSSLDATIGGGTASLDISNLTDSFHYVAVSWNSSTFSLYLDGSLRDSVSNSLRFDFTTLYVGKDSSGGSEADSLIDELAIFDYAKTSSEIASDYTLGLANNTVDYNLTLNMSFGASSGSFNVTGPSEFSGTERVRFLADDGFNGTPTSTISIIVSEVDDSPTISATMPNVTIDEGSYNDTLDLDGYFSDVDSTLSYSSSVNESDVSVTIGSGNVVNISSPTNFYGLASITFTASDGNTNVSQSITLNVTNVNDAPEIDVPSINMTEDTSVAYNITSEGWASDVDDSSDTLTFTIIAENESEVNCTVTTSTLNLTPAADYYGLANCSINVTDPSGATDSDTFIMNVSPVNDVPSFVGAVETNSNATSPIAVPGENATFSANISDIDSSTVKLLVCTTNNQSNALCVDGTFCSTSFASTGVHACNYTTLQGDSSNTTFYTFACDDSDECSSSSSGNFYLNHAPVLLTIENETIQPNDAYSMNLNSSSSESATDVTAIDVDIGESFQPALNFTLLVGPSGMSITGDYLNWTPNSSHIGSNSVTLQVNDSLQTDTVSYILYVNDTTPPVITINSPSGGQVTNSSPFLVNVTTDEEANCSLYDSITASTTVMSTADNLTHLFNVSRSTSDETHELSLHQ
jgi:hypothetical protein